MRVMCKGGDKEIVKFLLSKGLDPSSPKCLSTAMILYHHDIVITLITAGCNVNKVRFIRNVHLILSVPPTV